MSNLSGRTTIVVGASRGLGLGIATALAEVGAPVVAVSRTAASFPEPASGSGTIQPEIADAGEAAVAASLLDRYEPAAIILVAGATPHMRPLQQQTWETFSVNWQTDVRIAFHWLREALLKPLRPGSRVVVFSSGAATGSSTERRKAATRTRGSSSGSAGTTSTRGIRDGRHGVRAGSAALDALVGHCGSKMERVCDRNIG